MSESEPEPAADEPTDEQTATEGDVVVDAIIGAGVLEQYIETLQTVSSEGRIHVDGEGLHAKIIDPANVAMVYRADLSVDAFEAFSSGRVTLGVNLDRIEQALSVADSDDLVCLTVDMETRKCHLQVNHVDQTVRLIDPESIRKEPDTPDFDLPNSAVIEGREFDTITKVADMVSDHLAIEGDPDAEEVRFVAEGDIEDATVAFGHDEVIEASVTEETRTLLSLDYVNDLTGAIPNAAEVTVRFGHEFPVILEWEASDGMQTTEQMLAPRIKSH